MIPTHSGTDTEREISRLQANIEKVVVSDRLTPAQSEPWRRTTLIVHRADAQEHITDLKRQPGRDILVFGSRTPWSNLLVHGLVDELHLMVGSVVVGGGPQTFDVRMGSAHRPDQVFANSPVLRLVDSRTWDASGNVLVRYEVDRPAT